MKKLISSLITVMIIIGITGCKSTPDGPPLPSYLLDDCKIVTIKEFDKEGFLDAFVKQAKETSKCNCRLQEARRINDPENNNPTDDDCQVILVENESNS